MDAVVAAVEFMESAFPEICRESIKWLIPAPQRLPFVQLRAWSCF